MLQKLQPRQSSVWWPLVFIGACLVMIQFIRIRSSSQENHLAGLNSSEDEKFVMIPIADIMSGKPFVFSQNDKHIVDYIWSKGYIQPPSEDVYKLKKPNVDPSSGQGQYIRRLLKDMANGFFVECGAFDGEGRSNTLFLEKNLNWKGLLVEADPVNYNLMKKTNRKAWMSNTCLSIKPYPHIATFHRNLAQGKIENVDEGVIRKQSEGYVDIQCFPLFSLLTALNVTTVDYFSLDVEGAELQVLKTIPFDKVLIRTLSVEIEHTAEGALAVRRFMESQGYQMHGKVKAYSKDYFANDLIFVHKDVEIVW